MAQSNDNELTRSANIRLCRLCCWSNYEGFGFNFEASIHPPHLIRLVESNSPAAAGGLKILDVVLAVNELDASNLDYDTARNAIRSARNSDGHVELLVVEKRFYQILQKRGVRIDSSLATVVDTPATMPVEYQNFLELKPRTCFLSLHSSESGFGFELVDGENDIGAYIQEVFPNSPASRTQLRKSDRIIEINDQFVDDNASKSILHKLEKSRHKGTVRLYVMDTKTYQHYKSNQISLSSKNERKKQLNFNPFGSFRKLIPAVAAASTLPSPLLMLLNENIRLCTINRASADDIFGFQLNYHEKENWYSLTIAPSRANGLSNAALAGIKSDDRLIEINDQNIERFSHSDILQRVHSIKYPQSLRLLVADAATYQFYKQQGKVIHRSLPNVQILSANTSENQRKSLPLPTDPWPRKCVLVRVSDFDGYGFESNEEQHGDTLIVDVIHPKSPARRSGLTEGDHIICIETRSVSSFRSFDETRFFIEQTFEETGQVTLIALTDPAYQVLKCRDGWLQSDPFDYQLPFVRELTPRLCRIILNDQEEKFEFTFQKENVQQIRDVNPNSSAYQCGLRAHDYILEINSRNAEHFSSEQILLMIDASERNRQIDLLVIDRAGYEYAQKHALPLTSLLTFVQLGHEQEKEDHFNIHDEQILDEVLYNKNSNSRIGVFKGDLINQVVDVLVVCPSSQYLFENICNAAGDSVRDSYKSACDLERKESIIAVDAAERIQSKRIYFLHCQIVNDDEELLRKSLEKLVSDAIEKVIEEGYQSVAFPAIACGQHGCSIATVAQTMIRQAYRYTISSDLSISFVIEPEQNDVFHVFQKELSLFRFSSKIFHSKTEIIANGKIEIQQGDLIEQDVDVIITRLSSKSLTKAILKAAGSESKLAYQTEFERNPHSILVATSGGSLSSKQIFFVRWETNEDTEILRQSLRDIIAIVIQQALVYQYTSLAFPAFGCGKHGCSSDVIVRTLLGEIKRQMIKRNLPWTVKFIINPSEEKIYEQFSQHLSSTDIDLYELPLTWQTSTNHQIRFPLSINSDEYQNIASTFDQAMREKYSQIIRIERIQNERWLMQYIAHCKDFQRRLHLNTEKRLFHGCSQQAAHSIIENGFNRSFAGVNGTLYGHGVYFSVDPTYSHSYAIPNTNGERCIFISRVLIGRTTLGYTSIKTNPYGFDSTTDGRNIFVTYHDAQAYAEYLITYK